MDSHVLELQELPETDAHTLEPERCCDTDWTSGQCTEVDPPLSGQPHARRRAGIGRTWCPAVPGRPHTPAEQRRPPLELQLFRTRVRDGEVPAWRRAGADH